MEAEFIEWNYEAKMGTLSGGQRKRVALAAALIQPSDLLILDEPTNHIDNESVAWLEQYLQKRRGALLMITHDRYFLDRVANVMLELDISLREDHPKTISARKNLCTASRRYGSR